MMPTSVQSAGSPDNSRSNVGIVDNDTSKLTDQLAHSGNGLLPQDDATRHDELNGGSNLITPHTVEVDPSTMIRRQGTMGRRHSVFHSLFANVVEKSFTFEAHHKNQHYEEDDNRPIIQVQEQMAECKVAITGPQQLLRKGLERQLVRMARYKTLYYLGPTYMDMRRAHLRALDNMIKQYRQALEIVEKLDTWYLPSCHKHEPGVEFLPVNFHRQQIVAWADEHPSERVEFYTSGALSAISLGFKDGGGLKTMRARLSQQLESRIPSLPIEPSPTAAYWHHVFEITEQHQRISYIKAQVMKSTSGGNSVPTQAVFFGDTVKQLWDIFAQMKSFADSLTLAKEVKILAEAFESFRQYRDQIELDLDGYEIVDVVGSPEAPTGVPKEERCPSSPTLNMEFEVEPLETQYTELEAHMACVVTKSTNLESRVAETSIGLRKELSEPEESDSAPPAGEDNLESLVADLRRTTFIVLANLERLGRTLIDAWNFRYLLALGSGPLLDLFYRCEYREDAIISQILSCIATGVASKLWFPPAPPKASQRPSVSSGSSDLLDDPQNGGASLDTVRRESYATIAEILPYWERLGLLVVMNSYLSCFRDEKSMLDDMWEGVTIVRERAAIRLVKSFSVGCSLPMLEGGTPPTSLRVSIPFPGDLWDILPENLQQGYPLKLNVALFSQGINDEQSIALLGFANTSMESVINEESFAILDQYANSIVEYIMANQERQDDGISRCTQLWRQLVKELGEEVNAKKSKNVGILHFASRIARLLHGVHFINCKSGKDRTSMAATLEEAFILQERFGLPDAALRPVLEDLRCKGTRMDNVRKNAGLEYYAFNALQIKLLPELYRPPNGFYGSGQT